MKATKMQTNRHLKSKLLILILTLSSAVTCAEPPPFDYSFDENHIIRVGSDHTDLNSLTQEARADAMRHIRALLESRDYDIRNKAVRALLSIDDSEAIRRLVDMYHHNDMLRSFSALEFYGRESVMPYLIRDLYDDHDKNVSLEGQPPISLKHASAHLLLYCIWNCEKLPADTRHWASSLIGKLSMDSKRLDQVVGQLKAWWEHNKEAMLAKHYDKATWLPK